MKRMTWQRILAFVIVMTMLFELLPMASFAVEDGSAPNAGVPSVSESASTELYVIGEVSELRDATSKHFRLSDGSYAAVEYGIPIHFQGEDDIWEEIDNTLTYANVEGMYMSENGNEERGFADTLYLGQPVFVTQQDGYQVEMSLMQQEEAVDEMPVDEDTPESEENEDAATDEFVMENDADIIVAEDAIMESISLDTQETTTAVDNDVLNPAEDEITIITDTENIDEEVAAESSEEGVPAIVINPGDGASLLNAEETELSLTEQFVPDKLGSTVLYENVFDGVDLMYENYGYNIKETIMVNEPQSGYEYSFRLDVNGLTPVLEEDGAVYLYDENNAPIYIIPAPYMYDANNILSYDVEYTLETNEDGDILTVSADEAWMNAAEREYPVAIDPTLLSYSYAYTDKKLYVTYVVEGDPGRSKSQGGIHYIGYSTATQEGTGKMTKESKMYVHLADLKDIPDGCVLVDASLQLYNVTSTKYGYTHINCPSLRLCAYPVTSEPNNGNYITWIENMTWNNQASYDTSSMLDYTIASINTCSSYLKWDITKEVERWYAENETNRTIALAAYESGTFTTKKCASVAFQGYQQENLPVIVLTYRSAIGLEDYYTYQSHSIGYAGNAFIGDYSGQLIISNTQAVNSSTLMPFSVNLLYNSYYATPSGEKCAVPELKSTGMRFGDGWKLDVVQYLGDDPDNTNYKYYIDADGTYHYFRKADGKDVWNDEDGLNLEIKSDKIYGSTGTSYIMGYSIINDKGAKLSFYNGLLVQQTDQNGNAIRYLYNDATSASGTGWLPTIGSTNKITKIVQRNVGETEDLVLATLTYESDGRLKQITDRAGNTYQYTITGNKLTKITYSVGPTVEYTYQADGKLSIATDNAGKYRMSYTYGADGRVSGYSESAKKDGSWVDGLAAAVTGNKEKTIYTACGPDGVLGTDDDILTTCLFDDAGRTCNIYSTNADGSQIYGASVGKYTATNDTSGKNNRIETSATIGAAAANWIKNSGFETENTSGGNDAKYWSFAGIQSGTNIVAKSDNHRTGTRSLKAWLTSASVESVSASQTITGLKVGQTYTFSAYVNTADAVRFNDDGVYLTVNNGSETISGTPVNYKTNNEIENGWTRIDVTFTAGTTNTVGIVVNGISGITYVDDVQLEKGDAPSNVNLLSDGGMEYSGFWSGTNNGYAAGAGVANSKAATVTSNPLADGYLLQTVPVNYAGANTFVLSGWAKADAMVDNLDEDLFGERKNFGLKAIINYTDGTQDPKDFYAPFNAEIRNEWQYGSLIIVPTEHTKTVKSIEVYCQYKYNNGSAYFDDVSLIKEVAQTMSYDDEGNLKSVATPGVKDDTSTYANGNLIEIVTGGNGTFTYKYDENHNLESASNGVITQVYDYSPAGNNVSTMLESKEDENGNKKQLRTSATYQEHQNLLHEVTDAQGGITKYSYIVDSARMYGTPNMTILPAADDQSPRTTYVTFYANDGKMQEQYINGTVSTHYYYTDENLTKVVRGGYVPEETGKKNQEYNLYYNAFDQLLSVAVGTTVLSENTYDGIGNLTSQAYGNGGWVSYTYDHLNRIKTERWSGGKDVEYFYSSEGYLAKKVDNYSGEELNYTYDSLNRLIGSSQLDANGKVVQRTEHQYDDSNRLSKQSWQLGDDVYSESYVYDSTDGSLIKVQNTDVGNYDITYDSLRRLDTWSHYYAKQTYTYRDVDINGVSCTTNQVKSIAYTDRNDQTEFVDFTLSYTYDGLGNITKIEDSRGDTWEYTYDAQGQMTKEIVNDVATEYVYDTYGNIREIRDQDGNILHRYTYDDDNWLDKLTAYDGKPIRYDENGNPTLYSNGRNQWNFSWSNGRQLTNVICADYSVSYTYDLNGIRNSKTNETTTYNYITQNGKVVRQTWDGNVLDIVYDTTGHPYCCIYNGSKYYYVCNLQGDVIRLIGYQSRTYVEYEYDAWGNILNITGPLKDTLGADNPIRYRGYYYDTETGFYYLQSRYYDPGTGRFINADSFASTGQGFLGYNMFAYCGNNPVVTYDPDGRCRRFLGFLWNIDCKSTSCRTSKNYIECSSPVSSVGSYYDSNKILIGNIYVVQEDQLAEINKVKAEQDVVIVDKRTAPNPTMQVRDSYKITDPDQQEQICQAMIDYNTKNPVEPAWYRTIESMKIEWKAHNHGYAVSPVIGYFKDNAKERLSHVDFDNQAEGLGYWDFLKK